MALTRGASAGLLSDLAGHFCPVLLTYADWPGETIRIHTGAGDLAWGGHTWMGTGKLVQFSAPEETGGLGTSEASVRVAATVEDMLAERGKVIRNRTVTVWFATTTEPGGNVLSGDPVELFTGYFDSRTGSLARQGEDLSHDMILGLGIGPSARASASITHGEEDQRLAFPGDTAGRLVQLANRNQANPPKWPE
jgi:hypothetical protein